MRHQCTCREQWVPRNTNSSRYDRSLTNTASSWHHPTSSTLWASSSHKRVEVRNSSLTYSIGACPSLRSNHSTKGTLCSAKTIVPLLSVTVSWKIFRNCAIIMHMKIPLLLIKLKHMASTVKDARMTASSPRCVNSDRRRLVMKKRTQLPHACCWKEKINGNKAGLVASLKFPAANQSPNELKV